MKVTVTFRHMENDNEVRSYVEEKVTKLAKKYLHRSQEAQIVLGAEKFRRTAEITLKADNNVLVGKEEKEDLRSAIDLALDKLEIQARKHRERYKPKRKSSVFDGVFAVFRGDLGELTDEGFEPQVIKVDKFVPKPMSVEDAILFLEDSRDDFIVFRNAYGLSFCVLYRMPDGHYGLIEQEA